MGDHAPKPARRPAKRAGRRPVGRRVAGIRAWQVAAIALVLLAVAAGAFAVAAGWRPWGSAPVGKVPSDLAGAVAYWTQVTRDRPGYAEGWYQLGLKEAEAGKASQAADHLARAVRLEPSTAAYSDALARQYVSLGRAADAAAEWERLGSSDASRDLRAGWLTDAAQARLEAGDRPTARTDLKAALELIPAYPRAQRLLEEAR